MWLNQLFWRAFHDKLGPPFIRNKSLAYRLKNCRLHLAKKPALQQGKPEAKSKEAPLHRLEGKENAGIVMNKSDRHNLPSGSSGPCCICKQVSCNSPQSLPTCLPNCWPSWINIYNGRIFHPIFSCGLLTSDARPFTDGLDKYPLDKGSDGTYRIQYKEMLMKCHLNFLNFCRHQWNYLTKQKFAIIRLATIAGCSACLAKRSALNATSIWQPNSFSKSKDTEQQSSR